MLTVPRTIVLGAAERDGADARTTIAGATAPMSNVHPRTSNVERRTIGALGRERRRLHGEFARLR